MFDYILKMTSLVIFSIICFFFYYSVFPGHYENISNLIFYFSFFLLLYFILNIQNIGKFFYNILKKYLNKNEESIILKSEEKNNEIVYTGTKIIFIFLIILYFCCLFYFNKPSINFGKYLAELLSIENIKNSFSLFKKIIFLSIFPILIFLISSSFGKKISSFLPRFSEFGSFTKILFNLNIGFFLFLTIISIFSFFGIYNKIVVFSVLALFLAISFKEFFEILKNIFNKKIILDKNDGFKAKIFLTQFFYFFSFFTISTGLIYIIRPFPRGWDELGVYMNFPNILAHSSEAGNFGEMYSWQIFTGIGYLFSDPVFAYFLNFSGYFLSFLTLIFIFSELFKYNKKSFLNPPIIFSSLFLALPMSVFHSIKDLKLDQALFFITSFIVYFLFINLQKIKNDPNFPKIYIFIIGILSGFAFSIKFTALFLIISILAVLNYFFIGFFGLLGFLLLLFSIFSFGNFWIFLNVSLTLNYFIVIVTFILGLILIFIGIFREKIFEKTKKYYLNFKNRNLPKEENFENNFTTKNLPEEKSEFKKYELNIVKKEEKFVIFKYIFLFLFGLILALIPWFVKNIYENYPNLTISSIIKGKELGFKPDLKNAFSQKEINLKNQEKFERRKLETITTNEDLRRYLGYESGILPYTNIFWNVAMQTNQGGKFTEIGYLFFLFIPLIFIFLPFYKRKNFYLFIIIFCFFQLLFFIKTPIFVHKESDLKNISKENIEKIFTQNINSKIKFIDEDIYKLEKRLEKISGNNSEIIKIWKENRSFMQFIKDNFAKINLPNGYFVIFFIFFSLLLAFVSNIYKNKRTFLFELNLVFTTVYIFFWSISSFSVVWYGITMYFCLFLMIGFSLKYILKEEKNELRFFSEFVIFIIFLLFFVFTLIPHTVSNFKEKSFVDYKLGKKTFLEQTFDLRNDYEKILLELNIGEQNKKVFLEQTLQENILKDEFFSSPKSIKEIINFLKIKSKNNDLNAKKSLENLYLKILYPNEFYKNKEKIFRVGTFFKYYIYENNKRIFEDGLLFYFYDYIFDKDIDKTVENFKKLGFKYLLIDLGTSTIDDSETHGLTKRYEEFLKTLSSQKLDFIASDSTCFKFALDLYKNDSNLEKYFENASITYDSYDENDNIISRNKKLEKCAGNIEDFLKTDFDKQKFSYIKNLKGKTKKEIISSIGKGTYVIFKIKE